MKVLIFCFILFFISGCSSKGVANVSCDKQVLKNKFPEYEYSGSITLSDAQEIYQRDVLPFETPKVNTLWKEFKKVSGESSCIYVFNSPEKDWAMLRGVKGFMSIRNKEIVEAFIIQKS